MRYDVVDLRDFYGKGTGVTARRLIGRAIRATWPDLRAASLLGLGYATPYLRPFLSEAGRIASCMTPSQGVLHWPPEGPNRTLLAEEGDLPFADVSIDRVLAVHALEHSENPREMLREIWRVMAAGGRLLIVVPNRAGIWARVDRTPFGMGHPYTAAQLSRLLRDNMFTPIRTAHALYMPPTRSRTLLAAANAWENIGSRWFSAIGGATLIEAAKQLYAATPEPSRRRIVIPARLPARQTATPARTRRINNR